MGTHPRLRPLFFTFSLSLALLTPLACRSAGNIRILVDGRTLISSGATVRDALSDAQLSLGKDDQVSPALDQPAPADGVIRVSRVTYSEGTQEVPVPYKTVVRPASRGNNPYHPTVMQEGRSGLKQVTFRAKLVDGKEVERTTVSEKVVREPLTAVVISRNPTAIASRGAYAGKRSIKALATAYDPGPGSCGKYANGRTCNGKRAGYGIIAVDPKVFPLGAKLYVEGYGYGIAADVGGAIKGEHVDLGFNSRAGAKKWGKRKVTVVIVD